jgi:7-cyano-7-deazaguanine reductase
MSSIHEDLKALGQSAQVNGQAYAETIASVDSYSFLERFPSPTSVPEMNPAGVSIALHIETAEFTSLCPMTGQPDFANIVIDYVPDQFCVESKSLKLYYLSFRNRRDFHESCVVSICNDLVKLLNPKSISVRGEFTPRGGIPFWPTATWNKAEADAQIVRDEYGLPY